MNKSTKIDIKKWYTASKMVISKNLMDLLQKASLKKDSTSMHSKDCVVNYQCFKHFFAAVNCQKAKTMASLESCLRYNKKRIKYYALFVVVTIGIMVGIDFGLSGTNECFNTYSMLAQLFDANGSYQYLCYQNEVNHPLAVAFTLLVTFHILLSIFLFHVAQTIIHRKQETK